MPVNGPYQFRRAAKSDARGMIDDENEIQVDEWAWVRRPGDPEFLMLLLRDPDCRMLATIWRRFGSDVKGHQIDAQGNVHPSILHTWLYGDPPAERCGFHSMPTRLLDFTDIR